MDVKRCNRMPRTPAASGDDIVTFRYRARRPDEHALASPYREHKKSPVKGIFRRDRPPVVGTAWHADSPSRDGVACKSPVRMPHSLYRRIVCNVIHPRSSHGQPTQHVRFWRFRHRRRVGRPQPRAAQYLLAARAFHDPHHPRCVDWCRHRIQPDGA